MNFNVAQTFLLDAEVGNQVELRITAVDLYLKYKPPATNTRSGINYPGMTVYLTETIYGVPKITANTYSNFARQEWHNIVTSSDASTATRFKFNTPVSVKPGQVYAYVVSFDGNENFWLWNAKKGEQIVGGIIPGVDSASNQTVTYPGTTAKNVLDYFEYIQMPSDITDAQTKDEYISYWRALNDTDMKFRVFAARYFIDGEPISQNNVPAAEWNNIHQTNLIQSYDANNKIVTYSYPSQCIENITFDINKSNISTYVGAQRVYQNTVFYPGGYHNGVSYSTVSTNNSTTIVAGSTFPNGTAFNWQSIYNNYSGIRFITLFDTEKKNIRKITNFINATAVQLDEPVTFTNSAAKFMISPVAIIDSFNSAAPFGKKDSFVMLAHSNANSSVRFVNDSIESITVTNGGTNYSNNDKFFVTGYEYINKKVTGGYAAVGNIVTNSSGGITAIYLSNVGCGFTNTALMKTVIANSSFDPSTLSNTTPNTSQYGNGATFTYNVGTVISTELTPNYMKGCKIVNLDINDITPFFSVTSSTGTSYRINLQTQYVMYNDTHTSNKFVYYLAGSASLYDLSLMKKAKIVTNNVPAFLSFSNEFITRYSNGAVNDKVDPLQIYSNNYVLNLVVTSNNDWVSTTIDSSATVEFGKYIINNDYSNEHTNSGNAWAKHLTTKINFTRLAEDIRFYISCYKPINTNFQVYARIYNSADPVAIDDHDWTRLQLIDGNNLYSSLNKEDDYIELTYGFQPYANVVSTLSGSVSTSNNSNIITGVDTAFTGTVAVNDLIRIYDPLFGSDDYMVAMVTAIANNTSLTIDQPVLSTINQALINSGLKVDKLGYPFQAYNNIINENIVRYYNTSRVKFDGYDTLELKVVMLSSKLTYVPRIDNIRATGVSA